MKYNATIQLKQVLEFDLLVSNKKLNKKELLDLIFDMSRTELGELVLNFLDSSEIKVLDYSEDEDEEVDEEFDAESFDKKYLNPDTYKE